MAPGLVVVVTLFLYLDKHAMLARHVGRSSRHVSQAGRLRSCRCSFRVLYFSLSQTA